MSNRQDPRWLKSALVLVAAFMFAVTLAPGHGLAKYSLSNGGGSVTEGDPIDSNDFDGLSGGGGGSDSDIHDNLNVIDPVEPVVPRILVGGRWSLMLVLDSRAGIPSFRVIVIENRALAGGEPNAQ